MCRPILSGAQTAAKAAKKHATEGSTPHGLSGASLSKKNVKDGITQSVERLLQEKVDERLGQKLAALVKENEQRQGTFPDGGGVVCVEGELRAFNEI